MAAGDPSARLPGRLVTGRAASALSGQSQGSASSPSAQLAPQYGRLKGMVNGDSALRIQMAVRTKQQEAQRALQVLDPSGLSTLEEEKEESLHETVTSSAQWEVARLEGLNSELDLWSDHPSAFEATALRRRGTLMARARTVALDPTSPAAIAETSADEGDSALDGSEGEEGEEDGEEGADGEEGEGNDPDAAARDARAQAEAALGQMNTQKAQLRKDAKKRRQTKQEQEELCGPRLAAKIEKMLASYNQGVGLVDDNGGAAEGTASEIGMLASDASSALFQREQNRNDNKDQHRKFVQAYGDGVKQELAFYQLAKKQADPKHAESEDSDPKIRFLRECAREHALAVPILRKIQDRALLVRECKINTGQAKGLLGNFLLARDLLTRLYLDSNGLDGPQLALILHGLTKQLPFKALVVQNNQFDQACAEEVHTLLKRKMPDQLEELHLVHAKCDWNATRDLCQHLRRNYLRKLSLVSAGLNDQSLQQLAHVVKSSKSLVSLDLSWNTLTPGQLKPMLQVLSTNRRLQSLNLAWNNISEPKATEKEQLHVIHMIGKMIKHNRAMQHMDLTSTGLSSFLVKEVGNALRKARALLCIHLSGNQGVADKGTKAWLVERIKCRPGEDIARFSRIRDKIGRLMKDDPPNMLDGIKARVTREVDRRIKTDRTDPISPND